jgi:putative RNA 2'-phosphotransferase
MDRARAVRISKTLALALRHDPSALGIELDGAGWAPVDEVIAGLATKGEIVTREELEEVVATSDKRRYALSPDGDRIRANQGHSVDVDLGLSPREPPETLFHGTVDRFLESIRERGLVPGARTHVHLSIDVRTAEIVAARREGAKAILRVRAGDMHRAGHVFFVSDNGVWLTAAVPPEFLDGPLKAAP